MVQYPAKPFLSNITGSYVFVSVDVRPERSFGIVGVDHLHIVDAEHAVDLSQPTNVRRRRTQGMGSSQVLIADTPVGEVCFVEPPLLF
jgi:hypothetical protein